MKLMKNRNHPSHVGGHNETHELLIVGLSLTALANVVNASDRFDSDAQRRHHWNGPWQDRAVGQ
jgi:hypothetical protein